MGAPHRRNGRWHRLTAAPPRNGPDSVVATITELACHGAVTALGVAVPGHLSRDRRSTRIIPNLPGDWNHYLMADRLHTATGVATVLLNDARAFAVAELELGAAHGGPDTVFVTMGTGIGGAMSCSS